MNRREVITALAILASPLGRSTVRPVRAATTSRPRFYLQIVADGGMDPVFTTDPKTVREVDPGIDVPYPAARIVETTGARLGPPFKPLASWANKLAVVNAFHQNSANHISGMIHTLRCHSRGSLDAPTLLELLGANRGEEAVGAINIGATQPTAFSPSYLGEPSEFIFGSRPGLFKHLDAADPDDLRQLATVLEREAGAAGRATAAQRTTATHAHDMATFFRRVAAAPRFAVDAWGHPEEDDYGAATDLQRALWLFEHKLARCVTVTLGKQSFDSHYFNTLNQEDATGYLAFVLDKLFGALERRSVDGRSLASQTVVMVSSEIGRFPRLNHGQGKDHFPQAPYLFYGEVFATGVAFGATGRDMAALPVTLATGRPTKGGHVLRVDDIGSTLLALDGIDPELHGYTGARLRFLTG